MSSEFQQILNGSPYSIEAASAANAHAVLQRLNERVEALRSMGRLTSATLARYYGMTRFQQVAQSNAIEGSTLSVGETELAIVKGITLTGHDPSYIRDAISLDNALNRLSEMAKEKDAVDIIQVKELHGIIMDGRPSAGAFRTVAVRLSGSEHRPPKTWDAVMSAMEEWETWSLEHVGSDPLLRGAILHAWLVHIHPFLDGNGRLARAITNLELIRAGYPPIIIRRTQDRNRYINALQCSDIGGDISEFLELIIDRFQGALLGLEGAAREVEGVDPVAIRIRQAQERKLQVWNRSVELLYQVVLDRLATAVERNGGQVQGNVFRDALDLDDYISLCNGNPVSRSWAFKIRVNAPALVPIERLAWIGFRSTRLQEAMGQPGVPGPSIFWSKRNPGHYPPWDLCTRDAPGVMEMSITPGVGDDWHILDTDERHEIVVTTELAKRIINGFVSLMSP